MKILVTGAAGFIGFHTTRKLLERGHQVVGIDNLNDYYDVNLKILRLQELGISIDVAKNDSEIYCSNGTQNLAFVRADITDYDHIGQIFERYSFDVVCHLAAQAGVRYSLENPKAYIDSNISGFFNILEYSKRTGVKHLVYASSSSVYGLNKNVPFKTSDMVDNPISLYAATKKSNELMAHTYSHLYNIPTTGLRFFTVYGPWGRPDMAMFLFTDAMLNKKPIRVFNHGKMERDFTYIDDIVTGVTHVLEDSLEKRRGKNNYYKVYNIGNNSSVKLMSFIEAIEKELGVSAKKEFLPMQDGDVVKTWADVDDLVADYGYRPNTPIEQGVANFIKWYKHYYKVE